MPRLTNDQFTALMSLMRRKSTELTYQALELHLVKGENLVAVARVLAASTGKDQKILYSNVWAAAKSARVVIDKCVLIAN